MKPGLLRFVRQLPEAGRCWIAAAPRSWPACDRPYLDLAKGRLEPGRVSTTLPHADSWDTGTAELTYFPPVAIAHRAARDALVADAVKAGVPCLVQLVVGEPAPSEAVLSVTDLTGLLLAGEWGRLDEVEEGSHVLWPLVPGIADQEENIGTGLSRLAAAGVRTAGGMEVEISPVFCQRLAAGRPAEVFDALFRRPSVTEAAFASRAAARGLGFWPERPATGVSPRERHNRRVAAALAESAELWQRLGRPEAAGQALWRAARDAETSTYDLFALGREGNLSVLDWLDDRGLEVAAAVAQGTEPSLLRELRAAYVGAS